MKVLAVFATQGRSLQGPYSGWSNRVFEIERLDEAAVVSMEETFLLDHPSTSQPSTALLVNVIPLEG